MTHLLDDVSQFKKLVEKGIPKLFNGNEFDSYDERQAVILYIQRFGLQLDSYTGRTLFSIDEEVSKKEFMDVVIEGVLMEVHNTFRGNYGI